MALNGGIEGMIGFAPDELEAPCIVPDEEMEKLH